MGDEEDTYVWELITQYQLDIYRHLTPKTTKTYAREVNLLADFADALPSLEKSDVMGGVVSTVAALRGPAVPGMLWLHLERRHGIKYSSIRKVRAVHSKVLELYGGGVGAECRWERIQALHQGLSDASGYWVETEPSSRRCRMDGWMEVVRLHMGGHVKAIGQGEVRVARDALCRGVHAELSFSGLLRPGEQVCIQREDVGDMICRPERAKALGVLPFVCLSLMGGTKNNTTAPCGVVESWYAGRPRRRWE
jgi:hypothetical protein